MLMIILTYGFALYNYIMYVHSNGQLGVKKIKFHNLVHAVCHMHCFSETTFNYQPTEAIKYYILLLIMQKRTWCKTKHFWRPSHASMWTDV